ncbi:MAG: 4-hydroxy-tetrahydrodipicolinate reductase [Verrucomicrobia bacterium]|nr:4-hydroxy-tetrahydrodipicolinate reductase [Verrucomicrobiota bacterium]MBV9658108.1 4-hydroxy-tetrahydrodipicolinate reductase [Verrucomicrobiota bacterium]
MSSALSIALLGASGRMGQAIRACVAREPAAWNIVAEIGRGDDPADAAAANTDAVFIDFSLPDATPAVLRAARALRRPLVLGTTGHDAAARSEIAETAETVPIVFAANFSVGVNTLFWLTRKAAEILGADFDLEVVEVHHRLKKDAPSGTARRLAEILAAARGLSVENDLRHGRAGLVGQRPPGEIGIHAVRGGDVVGEHTVFFAGLGERLELTHRATNRETFAAGALRAARWLRAPDRAPGLYDMEDVLGLKNL